MRAFRAGRIPRSRRREKRVPSAEPFGMLPTARSARSVSAFYSIAVRDTKERARDKGEGTGTRGWSPSPSRLSSWFQFFPRIVAIRSRGNAVDRARASSGRLRLGIAHRFQCAPGTVFSLYTITAQFAAWISVKPF